MKNKAIKIIKIIAIILGISFITITQSYAENTTEVNTMTPSSQNNTTENQQTENVIQSTETTNKTTSTNNKVTTAKKSSNANLKNLGIRPHDFSGFQPSKTKYDVTVPEDTKTIEVYAQAQDAKSKITGTGTKTLSQETTIAEVTVTAEDGTAKTYTINIKKGEETQDKEIVNESQTSGEGLASLTINELKLEPEFKTDTYEYTLKYIGEDTKLDIKATPTSESYLVEVVGNDELKEGENIITILVSKSNGDNVATYQITVNKSLVDAEEIAKEEAKKKENLKKIIIGTAIGVILLIIIIIVIVRRRKRRYYDNDYSEISFYGKDSEEEMPKALSKDIEEKIEDDDEYVSKEKARSTFLDEYNSDIIDSEVRKRRSKGKRFK